MLEDREIRMRGGRGLYNMNKLISSEGLKKIKSRRVNGTLKMVLKWFSIFVGTTFITAVVQYTVFPVHKKGAKHTLRMSPSLQSQIRLNMANITDNKCKPSQITREPVRNLKTLLHMKDYQEKSFRSSSFKNLEREANMNNIPCKEYFQVGHLNRTVITNLCFNCSTAGDSSRSVSLVLAMTVKGTKESYCTSLREICKRWRGHVSVAVLLDEASVTEDERLHPERLANRLAQCIDPASKVCFHFVLDTFSARKQRAGYGANFIPINTLRNVAVNNAHTQYVLVMEVDFIPMRHMSRLLERSLENAAESDKDHKTKQAFVVPVFGKQKDYRTLPDTKQELLREWDKGTILPIHETRSYKHGHLPTTYSKYRKQSTPYKATFVRHYEPYYVVDKSKTPFYPEELIFGQKDKAGHAHIMANIGFEFVVLTDVFLIHTSHNRGGREAVIHLCGSKTIQALLDDFRDEFPDKATG